VRRRHVEGKLLDEASQAWRLPLGQVEHEPRQGGGVNDGMLERALQAAADQPGIERVVAVLDQHRALCETQERSAHVFELGRTDQHRTVDVMALARIGIDRCAAVDERVEEGERLVQPEALGAELEHQERRVARRLDVEGDELRILEQCLRPKLGCVDRDLFPRHWLGGAARLEKHTPRRCRLHAHWAVDIARRAQRISSPSMARSSSTATP